MRISSNQVSLAAYWFAGLLLGGIAALVAGEQSGLQWLTVIGCCLCFAAPAVLLLEFHRSGMIVSRISQRTFRSTNPLQFRIGMTLAWLLWGGAVVGVILHGLGYV